MAKTYLEEYCENPERMQSQQERLIFEVTQQMWQAMRERKVSRAVLAETLGITKGRVSQILNGRANLTLRSTADIFTALNKTLVTTQRDLFVVEPFDSRDVLHSETIHGWEPVSSKLWVDCFGLLAGGTADPKLGCAS